MFASLILYSAIDLASKQWALENLSRARSGEQPPVCAPNEYGVIHYQRVPLPPRPFIDGVLNLAWAENCGAAFSMLKTAPFWVRTTVFSAAALVACVVLVAMFVRGAGGRPFELAVPLILSGALCNLSDRVRHGFVVDFFQVDPDLFVYPIFNVADIVIFIGAVLLFLDGMVRPREQPVGVSPAQT
jgi:signal peptidase II